MHASLRFCSMAKPVEGQACSPSCISCTYRAFPVTFLYWFPESMTT